MKKILLSCFLALSFLASSQVTVFQEDFEDVDNGGFGTWIPSYFGALDFPLTYPFNTFAVRSDCGDNLISGAKSMQIVSVENEAQYDDLTLANCMFSNGSEVHLMYEPMIIREIDSRYYKNLKISYKYRCRGTAAQDYGRLICSVDDGENWIEISSGLRNGTSPYLTTVTDLELPADLNYKKFILGWSFVHNTEVTSQPGFTVDDILITGEAPTVIPGCATVTSPVAGSTIDGGSALFAWDQVTDATGYKLTIGTTPGGSNVYSDTVYDLSTSIGLPTNSTLYTKVVPTNIVGDAVGCQEFSFNTNGNFIYCTATSEVRYETITNVTFSNINNNSSTPPASGYQDFTSMVADATQGTTVPISITLDGYFESNAVSVWIDFNRDAMFSESEKTAISFGENATTATADIMIPANATVGNTRMRIALYDTYASPNYSGCGEMVVGEIEDYTVNILENLAVSDADLRNKIAVYPNPFKDILKISNVEQVKSIIIMDASGRMIKSLAPAAELNLAELKSGLYILALQMKDGSKKTLKAIKK